MQIKCNIPVYRTDGKAYVTFDDVVQQTGISRNALTSFVKSCEVTTNPFSFFPVNERQGILHHGTSAYTRRNIENWESVVPILANNYNYAIQFFLALANEEEKRKYCQGNYVDEDYLNFGSVYLKNAYMQVENNLFFDECDLFIEMIKVPLLEKELNFKLENWLCDIQESKKLVDFSRASGWNFKELVRWRKQTPILMHHLVGVMFCEYVDPNLGEHLKNTFKDVFEFVYTPDV